MSQSYFPDPQPGASLLLAFKLSNAALLLVGSNTVAAARVFAALEADSDVVIAARGGIESACPEIQHRVNVGQVTFVDLDSVLSPGQTIGEAIANLLVEYPHISLACVADTVLLADASKTRSVSSAREIYDVCHRHRIPVNVTDNPNLCDYTFPVVHRFQDAKSGTSTPLQISVTTNGQGCRLGSRIKRDILSSLPKNIGLAVKNIGRLRDIAKSAPEDVVADVGVISTRMQWIAQLSEFWPFAHLAELTEPQMSAILSDPQAGHYDQQIGDEPLLRTRHSLRISTTTTQRKGEIFLVGSGVGHPSLLTVASHQVLTQHATVVLTDKLVPSAILTLIPSHVEVIIARKFPGNADGAQYELMEKAVEAASRGQVVVRLKQGDPMVYGRAGEEILYFRAKGFEPVVIPGVSASIAGPTFANIPVTQRGVAESFVVCTGVGRGGKAVNLPGYRRERTVVVLMGVARLAQVVEVLCEPDSHQRDGAAYPRHMPIAIIERASMPDQRVVSSTLEHIVVHFHRAGEQRPPGLIVIGWAVLALYGEGDLSVLDDGASELDANRIDKWLGPSLVTIREGLVTNWDHSSTHEKEFNGTSVIQRKQEN